VDCDRFAAVAAELALGVLTGRERAEAIMQADRCDRCRDMVRELAVTDEQLLSLLPAVTPPSGLDSRVMSQLGFTGRHRRPVRTRLLLATAAAAVVALACGLGGWALHGGGAGRGMPLQSATLTTASHQMVGHVYLDDDEGTHWIYVSADVGRTTRDVICQLVGRDGEVATIGSFRLSGGYGYWGSPEPMRGTTVASARLLAADGHVLASATFGS
jgi:anti-sigma-K factor RskA